MALLHDKVNNAQFFRIQSLVIDCSEGAVEAQFIVTKTLILPCGLTCQYLSSESLVYFPNIDIVAADVVALQHSRSGEDGTQPRNCRIQCGPLAVNDFGQRFELVLFNAFLRGQNDPRGAIGYLR